MKPKITAIVPASDFPPEFLRHFSGWRPLPTVPYRVTVEFLDDETQRALLVADLQAARDELRAGKGIDAATMFAELEAEDKADDQKNDR